MAGVFKTYERTIVQRLEVATITEGNIHLIAAAVNARVDYSGSEPVIVTGLDSGKEMRWKLGWTVRPFGNGLLNQNGFNPADDDGEWRQVDE